MYGAIAPYDIQVLQAMVADSTLPPENWKEQ
jgi:hypothetical protein